MANVKDKWEVQGAFRPSWGGILAGAFVAVGLSFLLYLFAVAVGLTAVDRSPRGAGIWMAICWFVIPIVSMFVGGVVAGRLSGGVNRLFGALHGAVAWAFGSIVGLLVMLNVLAATVTSVGAVGSTVLGAARTTIGSLAGPQGGLINLENILAGINQQRAARGLQPITTEQLQNAVQAAAQTAVREGRIDRELLVTSLAQNTGLSRAEAEQLASQIETQLGQVQAAADQAIDAAAWYMWLSFFSTVLALGAALVGGGLGVSRSQRELLRAERVERPLVTRPTEVTP